MNVLKRELRTGIKPFILWTIGLFFLDFAGLIKYMGISATTGDADIMKLLDQFPRIVMAVFGMVGLDIKSLGGYYAILAFYALICVSIYAIHLGSDAVNREAIDKTYEFIFTKPLKRQYILGMKLLSGAIYLTVFCVLNVLFSILAVSTLKIEGNINTEMLLFGLSAFLVGMLFFSLGAFFAAIVKKSEKGSLYGNLSFLVVFIMGVIFDMFENATVLQFFSPLKYFLPTDLLNRQLNLFYAAVCIIGTTVLLWRTFVVFCKKDLTAT